ncbi:glycerol-3-phosphate dehydrogenase [Gloeopeniophorella convolvens]|nr:glycerol-3-phosphate dehydrogenase [Gloeopeniophorella convolvens]
MRLSPLLSQHARRFSAPHLSHNASPLCVCPRALLTRHHYSSPRLTLGTQHRHTHSYIRSSETMPSSSPSPRCKVLVLGAGNFGSCLADHLGDSEHEVYMWSREKVVVEYFNEHHKNPNYLKDHSFPTTIRAVGPELPDADLIKRMDVLLFAIPTQGLRSILTQMRPSFNDANLPLFIFVNKGIETDTNALTLEIIADTCGKDIARVATFLSGPSFATEIIKRQPTMVSIASLSEDHAERASLVFHQPWFRCYRGNDPVGIELAGALKNVYAIASGMAEGLGFEHNTRASLITRGLSEMTRIGVAYGANPLTFLSLAGVGDLFLTCSSSTSRNYTVGYRLGRGESLEEVLRTIGSVAEGVTTAKGLKAIVDDLDVPAPLANAVYDVLYSGRNVREQAQTLLERPMVKELDLPGKTGGPARALMQKLGVDSY